MKALRINFAPQRRLPRSPLYSLSLALAVTAAWQVAPATKLNERMQQQRATNEQMHLQLDLELERRRSAAASNGVVAYQDDAMSIALQRRFLLDLALASVEHAQVAGVRVKALDASSSTGSIKVEIEYGDQESLLKYVEDINAGESMTRWSLVQAQALQTGAGGSAVIDANWMDN